MSTENRVATFAHVESVCQFVGEAKALKCPDNGHEFTHADCLYPSIDLACLVADADGHRVSATVTGAFIRGGQNFVIVGARAFPLDQLRLHGVLSGCDVGEIAYVLKYLRKAMTDMVGAEPC